MQLNLRVLSCANIPRPEEIIAIDPYIKFNLTFSKKIHKTRALDNTFDPVWKQDFKIPIDPNISSFGIDISLRNSDAFGEEFEIGSVTGIIEDLKPYEVRKDSFEINIVDIDKEKRDAESLSKPISPDHLYTPRFIPNSNHSNENQKDTETESENKDIFKADATENAELNKNPNGTYVTLMFQIAPTLHPPFAKEGTPQLPPESKTPIASYRKGNNGYFLPSSFGSYIPRSVYERRAYSQKNNAPSFSFRNADNRKPISRGVREFTALNSSRNSWGFDADRDGFTSGDTNSFIGSNSNIPKPSFQYASPLAYRSRRRTTDSLSNSTSTDDKFHNAFTALTSRKISPTTATGKSPNSGFNAENFSKYYDSYTKLNSSRPTTTPNFPVSTPPTNSSYASAMKISTISPTSASSAASALSPNIINHSTPPKSFSIYNRNKNQQDFNNFINISDPTIDLNKPRNSSFYQKYADNIRKKQNQSTEDTKSTGSSLLNKVSSSAILARSLNKNPKEKINKTQTPSKNNDQPPPGNNMYNYDYIPMSESSDEGALYNFPYPKISDGDDEDDDDSENPIFNSHYFNMEESSNEDSASEDDDDDDDEDDYSELEDDNYPNQNQPSRNESNFRYYLHNNNNNNIRKRPSSALSNNNYSPYANYLSDDDDDVVEIDPPFEKNQPKTPKTNNYQNFHTFQPPPQIQLNSSANPVSQPPNDNINEADKKTKGKKRDIRFFFGPPEDNNIPPANEIKFVYNKNNKNTKSQKNDNKTNESNQPSGNSNESAGPVIFHYQAQKKGNSKKKGNRDDSPPNSS